MSRTEINYESNINIRLNPKIKNIIKQLAAKNGLSLSEYIRQLIYNDLKEKTITTTLAQAIKEEMRNGQL